MNKIALVLFMLVFPVLISAQDSTWQEVKINGSKMEVLTYSLMLTGKDAEYILSENATNLPEQVLFTLANSTKQKDSVILGEEKSYFNYSLFKGENKEIRSQDYAFKNGRSIYTAEKILESRPRTPYEAYAYLLNLVLVISFGFFGKGRYVKRDISDRRRLEKEGKISEWLYIISPGVLGALLFWFSLPSEFRTYLGCLFLAVASIAIVGVLYSEDPKENIGPYFFACLFMFLEVTLLTAPFFVEGDTFISLRELPWVLYGFVFLGMFSYILGGVYQVRKKEKLEFA